MIPVSVLFLSLKPEFASAIFNGEKLVELRRVRPRVSEGGVVLIYETAPVSAITGFFTVAKVEQGAPRSLWPQVSDKSGVDLERYLKYFSNAKVGHAIHVQEARKFASEVPLSDLRGNSPGFHPPQCYHYLSSDDVTRIAPQILAELSFSSSTSELLAS